jgi:hypothetical protein
MDMAVAEGFCGKSNGRGRGSSARGDLCAGSLDSLGEQFGQADEVIGGHREGELPIDFEQSAMPHLTQAGHRLGAAESFLDAFADALRERIAGMADGAAIKRRAAAAGVLRHMRGDRPVAQLPHKISAVIAFIGSERDRLRHLGVRPDQRQRRQPLGMARSSCGDRADNQDRCGSPSARGP